MRRLFPSGLIEGVFLLGEEDRHHLFHVLRTREGERFLLSYEGKEYLGEALPASEGIRLLEEIPPRKEGRRLVLHFPLLKNGNDELLVQKGTELGVFSFAPFLSERTIRRPKGDALKKALERFRKIAREASSQCGAPRIPEVAEILPFSRAFPGFPFLFADERLQGEPLSLKDALLSLPGEEIHAYIGPEGGFADSERKIAAEAGAIPLSLGPRILRAETAGILLSALALLLGEGAL